MIVIAAFFFRSKDIFYPYRISYVWYSMIACMLVVFVGIAVSLITGELSQTGSFSVITRGDTLCMFYMKVNSGTAGDKCNRRNNKQPLVTKFVLLLHIIN